MRLVVQKYLIYCMAILYQHTNDIDIFTRFHQNLRYEYIIMYTKFQLGQILLQQYLIYVYLFTYRHWKLNKSFPRQSPPTLWRIYSLITIQSNAERFYIINFSHTIRDKY